MVRIGQRLREERLHKGLSVEDVSRGTKIRTAFITAIEKGEYNKLPSSAYAQGFVRNYAEFLGLSKRETLALFRREFDETKVFKVLPDGLVQKDDFPIHRIRLQQTVITVTGVLVLLMGYILFQYRYAIISPPLDISSPKEKAVLSSRTINVSGKTDSNANLYVNNDLVSLESDGSFTKNVDLFPGKSTIKIKAINRFGRKTETERQVEIKQD